jgi:hypothetical protein
LHRLEGWLGAELDPAQTVGLEHCPQGAHGVEGPALEAQAHAVEDHRTFDEADGEAAGRRVQPQGRFVQLVEAVFEGPVGDVVDLAGPDRHEEGGQEALPQL